MEFAEKITALRKSRELTQEQLAERLGVSRQSISKWENGSVVPEVEKIIELSKTFDVTLDCLKSMNYRSKQNFWNSSKDSF